MTFTINQLHLANDQSEVDRFHPGPDAPYAPRVLVESQGERLARMERTFLEKAINIGLDNHNSSLASDARAIIVQRAAITG